MGRSKKIDEYIWEQDGHKRTVSVRMTGHNDPNEQTKFFSRLLTDDGDEKSDIIARATDVNDLYDEVDEYFEERCKTEWELFLFVGATRGRPTLNCDHARSTMLKMEFVPRGGNDRWGSCLHS